MLAHSDIVCEPPLLEIPMVWAGLSNSQSIGYSYTTISKRLKITTLKVKFIYSEKASNIRRNLLVSLKLKYTVNFQKNGRFSYGTYFTTLKSFNSSTIVANPTTRF